MGPLDGGKTLHPALVYINGDVLSTELIYLEIMRCVLTLGLDECDCVEVPSVGERSMQFRKKIYDDARSI